MESFPKGSIERLEKDRITALERQDALNYFALCEEMGVAPEDRFLHERGMLEDSLREENDEVYSVRATARRNNSKYSQFYQEGEIYRTGDFAKDASAKEALLLKYFPRRFGTKGKQSIERLTEIQKGALFKKLMDYSKEKILQ